MENTEKLLRVTDKSCTVEFSERTHTINVRGQEIPVTFKFGEAKVLPFEQGVKFMVDGFIVEDFDGTVLGLPAVAREGAASYLGKDEVIAKLSELTISALKVRAAQKNGGEMFLEADEAAKADIIAFIIGDAPEGLAVEAEVSDVEDDADAGKPVIVDPKADEGDGLPESGVEPNTNPETIAPQVPEDTVAGEATETVVGDISQIETFAAPDDHIHAGGLEPVAAADLTTPFTSDKNPEIESGAGKEPVASEQTFTLNEINGATDEALQLCVDYGIDVKTLVGSGENGNVLKGDVEKYISENNLLPVKHEIAE